MKFSTVVGFATLFSGRTDAYFDGDQSRTAYYYKGRERYMKPTGIETFRRHLVGINSIGTYPVLDDGSCRWGCIDIDDPKLKDLDQGSDEFIEAEHQAFVRATDVQSVWTYFGIQSWIERSRSKGFHVWTFTDQWTSASHIRRAGLYVAQLAGLPDDTEVNPKNEAPWLTKTGLVNTVRLPYYGRANPRRMVVTDGSSDLSIECFVREAMAQRTSPSLFASLAEDFQARQKIKQRQSEAALRSSNGSSSHASRQTSFIRQEAALILAGKRDVAPGERDRQFYTMANVLKSQGESMDLALRIISRVYEERCIDKTDFSLEDALSKVRNVYR